MASSTWDDFHADTTINKFRGRKSINNTSSSSSSLITNIPPTHRKEKTNKTAALANTDEERCPTTIPTTSNAEDEGCPTTIPTTSNADEERCPPTISTTPIDSSKGRETDDASSSNDADSVNNVSTGSSNDITQLPALMPRPSDSGEGDNDFLASAAEFVDEFISYYDDCHSFEAIKIRKGDPEKVCQFFEEIMTLIELGEQFDSLNDQLIAKVSKLKRLLNKESSNVPSRIRHSLEPQNEFIDLITNSFLPPSTWTEVGLKFRGYPLEVSENYLFFDRYIHEQYAVMWKDKNSGQYFLVWNSTSIYEISCEDLILEISGEDVKGDIDKLCSYIGKYRVVGSEEVDETVGIDAPVIDLTTGKNGDNSTEDSKNNNSSLDLPVAVNSIIAAPASFTNSASNSFSAGTN